MKKFKKFYIEITNICNLNCSFCPPTLKKHEFIRIDAFEEIIKKIIGFTDYVYLHVKGEPLLHPELGKILELCDRYHLKVNITTNGTLLKKNLDLILMSPAIRLISISLQSMEDPIATVRYEYIQNIIQCVKTIVDKSEIYCELRLWNNPDQKTDYLSIIEQEFELEETIIPTHDRSKGIKIAEQVYLNQKNSFIWPDLKHQEINVIGTCYGLRNQIAILVDGTVVPCCLDCEGNIPLGNIYVSTNLLSIIEGERAQAMIKGFSERNLVEKLCRSCDYRTMFD